VKPNGKLRVTGKDGFVEISLHLNGKVMCSAMTPEQARDLAGTLRECADYAAGDAIGPAQGSA
jgi:hypothetical protein